MRPLIPGAAALRLRNGTSLFVEEIPAALVREVIQGLPNDLPLAGTLRSWHGAPTTRAIEREQLEQVVGALLERAHGSQQDGSIARVPPHAGGQIMAPTDLDELTMSAMTALALGIQRFLLLWALGTEVVVVGQDERA